MKQMHIWIFVVAGLLACTACVTREPGTATPSAATPTPGARVSATPVAATLVPGISSSAFDAIGRDPCALLPPDRAEKLGWQRPRAKLSNTKGINLCTWTASDGRTDAYVSAVAPFDWKVGQGLTDATEITTAGRRAARYTLGRNPTVAVDLGKQRGLLVFTEAPIPPFGGPIDFHATEALASAVVENLPT